MNNEDYGVSDSGHVGMAFDALSASLDRINGIEGLSLVPAQIYVYSILEADGSLSRAERVAGNESFFGAIGNGLQAVWEFIAKIFKGIWNFFFGSSGDTIAKRETAAIARVESNAEEMKKSDQVHDERMAKLKAEDKADKEEAEKKKAERDAKYKKEEEEWHAQRNQRKEELQTLADKAERTSQKLTALADPTNEGKYKGTTFEALHNQLHGVLTNIQSADRDNIIAKAGKLNDVVQAIEHQSLISRQITRMKNARVPLDRIKSSLQSAINDLEKRVKETKKNDPGMTKLKSDLMAGKEFLQSMVELNKYLEATVDDCVKFSNWIRKSYKF